MILRGQLRKKLRETSGTVWVSSVKMCFYACLCNIMHCAHSARVCDTCLHSYTCACVFRVHVHVCLCICVCVRVYMCCISALVQCSSISLCANSSLQHTCTCTCSLVLFTLYISCSLWTGQIRGSSRENLFLSSLLSPGAFGELGRMVKHCRGVGHNCGIKWGAQPGCMLPQVLWSWNSVWILYGSWR